MPHSELSHAVRPGAVILIVALVIAACVWAGCTRIAPPPAASQQHTGPYVGSAACQSCHPEIFEKQSATHHALTLAPMYAGWPGSKIPSDFQLLDRATNIRYGLATRHDGLYEILSREGKEIGSARIDYLLGSGHHGVSPMTFDGVEWRYLALTYYASHGWDFSPMHESTDPQIREQHPTGLPVSIAELRKCFGCHSVRVEFAGSQLDPEKTELGVRCESCHGPGQSHLEAVRNKSADLAVNNPGKWSTESFMALCEQCHNETATLDGTLFGIPKDPNSPQLAKYQIYELEQSRCFVKSGGKMRCTTCHDPHGDTEPSPEFYTGKCLGCHQPSTPAQTACPVNPKDQCTSCHMPKVQVEKYTRFSDHWIRARSPFAPGQARATGAASPRSRSRADQPAR
ncbi:MAG: multiheme c-type cytochrome [Actinomycetota bacterium]